MELYVLVVVMFSIICYLFARNDVLIKRNQDLHERLLARNHDEYLQNTGQQPEPMDIEYHQLSYYDRPKAVIRKPNKEVN